MAESLWSEQPAPKAKAVQQSNKTAPASAEEMAYHKMISTPLTGSSSGAHFAAVVNYLMMMHKEHWNHRVNQIQVNEQTRTAIDSLQERVVASFKAYDSAIAEIMESISALAAYEESVQTPDDQLEEQTFLESYNTQALANDADTAEQDAHNPFGKGTEL